MFIFRHHSSTFFRLTIHHHLPHHPRAQVFWHAALFHECQQLATTVFDLYKKSVRQSAQWDLTLDSLLRWCVEIPVGRRPLVRGGARSPEAVAQVLCCTVLCCAFMNLEI